MANISLKIISFNNQVQLPFSLAAIGTMEFIFANNFPSDGEKVQGVCLVGRDFSSSNKISKLNSPGKSEVSITVGSGGIFPTLDVFSGELPSGCVWKSAGERGDFAE